MAHQHPASRKDSATSYSYRKPREANGPHCQQLRTTGRAHAPACDPGRWLRMALRRNGRDRPGRRYFQRRGSRRFPVLCGRAALYLVGPTRHPHCWAGCLGRWDYYALRPVGRPRATPRGAPCAWLTAADRVAAARGPGSSVTPRSTVEPVHGEERCSLRAGKAPATATSSPFVSLVCCSYKYRSLVCCKRKILLNGY
jgi:hypothetical protein